MNSALAITSHGQSSNMPHC